MPSSISTLITREQHDACVAAIRRGLQRTLSVKMPLTASQWADRHYYLSPESSGSEGKWESLPYQVAMLDVMGADEPRIVDVKKCARVGYTKTLCATLGYFIEHKRRNGVLYQPTDEGAKKFCKSEIDPMIRDVPALAALSDESDNRKRDDTLTTKRLGKKMLHILGGKAPTRFRQITSDLVVYDELDGFDQEIGDEGDPLRLGDRCITNSSFPKSIRGSTPALKHNSLIEKESGNAKLMFRYHVRCPECDHAQPLEWRNFAWNKDGDNEARADSVRYLCAACDVPWMYSEIWPLLESGHWETVEEDEDGARVPGFRIQTGDADPILLDADGIPVDWPRHVAFHIWAAYSPYMTWADLVLEWLEAQGDHLKLKTFTNHRFGEVWEDEGEQLDQNRLFEKRQNFNVPADVLAVLASVDVQDNRVEVECGGFGYREEAWHLEHKVFYGSTENLWSDEAGVLAPVWRDLNDYLSSASFARDDGVNLRIDAVGIDTGYRTETVYRYVTHCAHPRVFALKGISGDGRPVVSAPSRQKTIDDVPVDLFGVGVDNSKAIVVKRFANFAADKSPSIHLNTSVTQELCEQLTAEKRVTKYRRGFEVREWVKIRPRNEFLDLWSYLFAVLYIVNPSWKALDEQRTPDAEKREAKARESRTGGNWVTGWR